MFRRIANQITKLIDTAHEAAHAVSACVELAREAVEARRDEGVHEEYLAQAKALGEANQEREQAIARAQALDARNHDLEEDIEQIRNTLSRFGVGARDRGVSRTTVERVEILALLPTRLRRERDDARFKATEFETKLCDVQSALGKTQLALDKEAELRADAERKLAAAQGDRDLCYSNACASSDERDQLRVELKSTAQERDALYHKLDWLMRWR